MSVQWLFTIGLLLVSVQTNAFTLITFDVDGTLVKGSGQAAAESAHAKAFSHAVGTILGDGKSVTPVAKALPGNLYHGSTDGLISLRLAKATLGIDTDVSYPKLEQIFQCMFEYMSACSDEEVANLISPLPGVLDQLKTLSQINDEVMCGLVTGNVEGIARLKMRAVGVWDTQALSPPSPMQKTWPGTEDIAFLGGFGSDFCSGNIDDIARNHLDRGEQIAIATERCRSLLQDEPTKQLERVVHVGDAPADVLAAKAFSETLKGGEDNLCVGMVAVATGSYSAEKLRVQAGETIPGKWEPVVLEDGMNDPNFLAACGASQ
ncbi:unnamed protein product [Cylindrotheca closterium]|uniref:Haloacid dehalogenase-like hydrolase n=1 Tax=Cylindrotheca closterium TaxID=2856 RepID=A0AAD2G307_9STRA|nr:unnamed protein product [Cylindrotheca closterium]